jgi:hypothetical protein
MKSAESVALLNRSIENDDGVARVSGLEGNEVDGFVRLPPMN